jgi:hypothetical protein
MQKQTLILALLAVSSTASAAPLVWKSHTGNSDDPDMKVTQSCPAGTTVVGGGVTTESMFWATRSLQSSVPADKDTWLTITESVDGAPSEKRDFEVSALCASADVAACIEVVEAEWTPDTTSEKEVVAQCPAGTLAFAGGAEITGTTYGRGFRKLGPGGLFFPTSWVADVAAFQDDASFASDWGVHVVAYCAPDAAMAAHVTIMPAVLGDGLCIDSDCMMPGYDFASDTDYRYGDPGLPLLASCVEPLSVGMSGDEGRFVVMDGAHVANGFAESYEGRIGTFTQWLGSSAVALCADNLASFGNDVAAACVEEPEPEPKSPWEIDLSRWAIGGRVMFGLIGGGNGVIWLPGVGPVPVDPEPIQGTLQALPVAVAPYDDPRALDATLDTIARALEEERTSFTESSSVEEALRTDELLFVTPEDEEHAVAWLSANRERLAERTMPVVVFLEAGGAGEAALERW